MGTSLLHHQNNIQSNEALWSELNLLVFYEQTTAKFSLLHLHFCLL